jgi:AcrR family transcriptional regulator
MARPRNADPTQTRRRLLDAATALFSRHGEATSVRDIARAAGVTVGTVHHYFGNKQGLYDAAVVDATGALAADLAPLAQLLRDIAEQVQSTGAVADLVRSGFTHARQHRAALTLVMRPLVEEGELDARWAGLGLVPFLEHASGVLAEHTGRSAQALRLPLQSVVALGMRYALSTPAELARLAGLPAPSSEADEHAVVQAIADHLAAVATALLEA